MQTHRPPFGSKKICILPVCTLATREVFRIEIRGAVCVGGACDVTVPLCVAIYVLRSADDLTSDVYVSGKKPTDISS